MFTLDGTPDVDPAVVRRVAMLKHDAPGDASVARAVRRGFIVRTRADTVVRPAVAERGGGIADGADGARRRAAFASGAQLVSFDHHARRTWRELFGAALQGGSGARSSGGGNSQRARSGGGGAPAAASSTVVNRAQGGGAAASSGGAAEGDDDSADVSLALAPLVCSAVALSGTTRQCNISALAASGPL